MRTAYVGIADRNRLLAWWPEHPETCRFRQRRQRRRPREMCFWAVLPEEEAQRIAACLESGEPIQAFHVLEQSHLDMGRILPPASEPVHRA